VRVLYVTNGFPYPLTSGYLRHWFLINELAGSGHEIALLSLSGRPVESEDRAVVESVCASVTVVPASGGSRLRRQVATAVPAAPVDGPAAELGRRGAALAGTWRPDVVLFSGKRTYPVLGPLPELPVVSDLCDATSSRLKAGLRHGSVAMAPARLVEWAGIRHVERRLLARSSSVLFASARDRDAVVPAGGAGRAVVVPNGVDLGYWQRGSDTLGQDTVVFTGAMDYGPNEDAALQLVQAVWPLVRAERPGAELLVVGRDPGPDLRRAATEGAGVTVTGTVPDVRPFLERASVFAAPLRVGAGIQNKVLEALAMEVPVVASSLAAGGLRTPEGQDPPLSVADGPAATAAAVVAALRRAESDPTPAAEGRAFVAAHFSWRRSGELVAGALERATVGVGHR
jgi:glycosyltransferase involved in cell wall biosynthesis